MIRSFVVTLMVAFLMGCAQLPPKVNTVIVKQDIYVPIPDALTAPCPIEEPNNWLVTEVVRVARSRKASLEQCNIDKATIHSIQGTRVPLNKG